jgi:PAS domain S-box-containing protein
MLLIEPETGDIINANPAACAYYGYSHEEITHLKITDINQLSREQVFEEMGRAKREQRNQFFFRHRLANGEVREVEVYSGPIEFHGKTFLYSIVHDITQRKLAEEKLRQTAAELARSNAELEQFAYIASHDLQEPLRAVAGTVQLLQKRYGGQLDERADELIRHAVEGATRMQTLINDLLAFSRVGTRGQPFQPIDSAGALADALANLTIAVRESGAVITHDHLPTVMADRTQITQLFQNLVANAIKFRDDRPPAIQISVERQKDEWLFAVADNGIGLEAQYFERIFGVFQRLHTRREYPGTGIGLALCKKIVERHGGRIWVESEPGQGSTFYFTLPERENSHQ